MNSRIRYEKFEDTRGKYNLVSTRNFHSESTDAMYIIYLNTEDMTFTIKNMLNRRLYEGGDGINNLHVLKRHAKRRLETLGVRFNNEIRDNSNRIKGVNCGYSKESIEDIANKEGSE